MEEKTSLQDLERIIEERKKGISDQKVSEYVELLFLRQTAIAEAMAIKLKTIADKTDAETAAELIEVCRDMDTLKATVKALELLSKDIGTIKDSQLELGKDVKGLRHELEVQNDETK
jgi:hypothetical protein